MLWLFSAATWSVTYVRLHQALIGVFKPEPWGFSADIVKGNMESHVVICSSARSFILMMDRATLEAMEC